MEVIGIDAGQPHAPPGVYIRATAVAFERPRLLNFVPLEGTYATYVAREDPTRTERQQKPVYAIYEDAVPVAVFEAHRREQWKQALVWAVRRVRERGDDVLTIGYPGRGWWTWPGGYRPPRPKHVNITSAFKSPRKHFTAMLDPDILD